MNKWPLSGRAILLLGLVLSAGSASAQNVVGEFTLGAGVAIPSGNYQAFTEDGFRLYARITPRIPFIKAVGGWFDLDVAIFSEDHDDVDFNIGGFDRTAERTVGEYAVSLHIGTQLGSDTRRGFIRPRVGAGLGLYTFWTNTSIKMPDSDENIVDEAVGQMRPGWRAIAGIDFFKGRQYGVAVELVHDQVWNFRREVQLEENGPTIETHQSARFWGITVGLVVALDFLDED